MPINFITTDVAAKMESQKSVYRHNRAEGQSTQQMVYQETRHHLDEVRTQAARYGETICQVSLGKSVRTATLSGEDLKLYAIPAGEPDPDCDSKSQGGILASVRVVLRFDTIGPTITYRNDEKGNPVITEADEPFDVGLYSSYNLVADPAEALSLVPAKRSFPSGILIGTKVVEQYFALLKQAQTT